MTSSLDMIRGRSNIVTLTNNSGGALVAGDVCIQDTSADENVTTTTSAASLLKIFVAAESIAGGATGKFYSAGFCPLVTPSASTTRGRYLFTHTVAKQAAENATYGAGAFGVILKSGTTPSAWLFGSTAQGSGGGVARSGATTDGHLAVWNGSSADSIKDGGTVPTGAGADGWSAASGTWTYSSADAPTYVISVNADMTGTIGVGQRIKLTDSGTKYFIVTAVGAFGGGVTLITVYGGTDYALTGGAITAPSYSVVKAPFGFPTDPAKWTVSFADTSDRQQTSPTKDQWYNLGTANISLPIGAWSVFYQVYLYVYKGSAGTMDIQCTLSTANNSESDKGFTCPFYLDSIRYLFPHVSRGKNVTVASKTAYYLNTRTANATASMSGQAIGNGGSTATTMISAVCAYL